MTYKVAPLKRAVLPAAVQANIEKALNDGESERWTFVNVIPEFTSETWLVFQKDG